MSASPPSSGSTQGRDAVVRDDGPDAVDTTTLRSVPARRADQDRLRVLEERLRLSEELYRNAFDASLTGMTLTAVDGRLLRSNDVFAAMLGRSAESLVGVLDTDLTHPAHRARLPQVAQALAGTIDGFAVDRCYQHQDGSEVWVQLSSSLVRDDTGRPVHFSTQMVDTTERRRAQHEQHTRDEMLRTVIANSRSLIYVKDLDGRYLLANERFERAFGVSEAELLGQDDTFLDPQLAPLWRANDLRAQNELFHVEEWSDGPHGSSLFESVKFPLRDADGRVYATCGISEDVTAARRAQTVLTETRDAALAATEAKSAFLAAMSHEIRTPLNAVIGMTDLLLDTGLDSTQRDFTETVQASGEALLAVINNVLDFSKIESGHLELEHHAFTLADCVESALSLVAVPAQAKGLELVANLGGSCPQLVGDGNRLQQMLVNLLSNAVKFTSHGEVLLTARTWPSEPSGDGVVRLDVSVSDTGIGIPADRLDRLFRAFSQVDSSTTRLHGGTGLGLAITHRLAEAMGGDVTVVSEPGVGSVFTLSVQLVAGRDRRVVVDGGLSVVLAGKSVLVVDDNATNRRVLRLQLEGWGATCTDVGVSSEALGLVTGGAVFDVAILDMQMPDMDGQQLAAAIRSTATGHRLPMLMLTSLNSRPFLPTPDLFAAVLSKPVKGRQLLKILTRCLSDGTRTPTRSVVRRRSDVRAPGLVLNILLAEDNVVNQQVAQLMLRRLGHRVDIVGSGDEAVQAVMRESYDVVLMDVQMPRLDGLQATRMIRTSRGVTTQPYIVALTANAMAEDRVACLRAGMDGYLAKPVRAHELRDALTRLPVGAREDRGPAADDGTAHDRVEEIRRRLDELAGPDPEQDRVLFAQLLTSFTDRAPEAVQLLQEAVDHGDVKSAEQHAHSLKSSAGNLGATMLAAACESVEAVCRTGRCPTGPDPLALVRDEVAATVQAMASVAATGYPVLPAPRRAERSLRATL